MEDNIEMCYRETMCVKLETGSSGSL